MSTKNQYPRSSNPQPGLLDYFSFSFSVSTSELFFSFLEEFALIFLKDNLIIFNLIFKVGEC